MSVINDFWKEFGDQTFTFVDIELEKHELTLSEAKNLLDGLVKQDLDPESNECFLFNTIEGKINWLLQEFAKPYFKPYKCCIFIAGYSYQNGHETYKLTCIFKHTIYGRNTETLEEAYEHFKNETDRAGGIINC